MDKSSTTLLLLLLVSSSLVLTLFICTAIYISKHPHLQIIWLYSSSHPILALNLLILLIVVSSRCFAISRNTDSADHRHDRDQLLSLSDAPQRIIPLTPTSQAADGIAEAGTSKSKKKGTLESTSSLRQLKHSAVADRIAEAGTSRSKKKGTLESTSSLRQLKHSHITTEDSVRPPEMMTDRSNDEVTSSGSSSLSSAKLRREVSLNKEEVNRRVERFIRKFNDD